MVPSQDTFKGCGLASDGDAGNLWTKEAPLCECQNFPRLITNRLVRMIEGVLRRIFTFRLPPTNQYNLLSEAVAHDGWEEPPQPFRLETEFIVLKRMHPLTDEPVAQAHLTITKPRDGFRGT